MDLLLRSTFSSSIAYGGGGGGGGEGREGGNEGWSECVCAQHQSLVPICDVFNCSTSNINPINGHSHTQSYCRAKLPHTKLLSRKIHDPII